MNACGGSTRNDPSVFTRFQSDWVLKCRIKIKQIPKKNVFLKLINNRDDCGNKETDYFWKRI